MLFAAVLLTGLTMGLEFAHILEWPQKQHYPGPLYVRLQESLYIWFGNLGGVLYVLAVVATVALAVLARRDRRSRGVLGVAAGLQVVALAGFLTVIYPVNQRFPVNSGGAVPRTGPGCVIAGSSATPPGSCCSPRRSCCWWSTC
ncbi:MAG TPA: hypothetical protein VHX38_32700 [Pseudonocardiaceae bacterium]|nr:hypothetical protein [Pseudonocardiaceae bacterium]